MRHLPSCISPSRLFCITFLLYESQTEIKFAYTRKGHYLNNIRAYSTDKNEKLHIQTLVSCFTDGINGICNVSMSVFQDELKLALKQGTTLLGCIKEQAAKSENHKLNPDEMENQTTVERWQPSKLFFYVSRSILWPHSNSQRVWYELPVCFRLLAQLDETENAFEQFWCKHHLKLEQCLQLRHFEQDFREVYL